MMNRLIFFLAAGLLYSTAKAQTQELATSDQASNESTVTASTHAVTHRLASEFIL